MGTLFIAFVSEDQRFSESLGSALNQKGLNVAYRKLALGDNLINSINRGLRSADYAIIIISKAFLARWSTGQLEKLARIDQDFEGATQLLPVRYQINLQDIARYSEPLAERSSVSSKAGLSKIVDSILDAVQISAQPATESEPETSTQPSKEQKTTDVHKLAAIRDQIAGAFSAEELKDLCFDIGINYDDLEGEGTRVKARELVAYFSRRNQLAVLLSSLKERRPDQSWPKPDEVGIS